MITMERQLTSKLIALSEESGSWDILRPMTPEASFASSSRGTA